MTLTIIQDSREQLPFPLARHGAEVVVQALPEGDYSIVGLEGRIAIERKSGSDFYQCMTTGRDRFERELERLRPYEFSAVVCEHSEQDLMSGMFGGMALKSIKATLTAWETRYPAKFIFCPTRAWAERTTYLLLERFWRDVRDGKRPARGEAA